MQLIVSNSEIFGIFLLFTDDRLTDKNKKGYCEIQ